MRRSHRKRPGYTLLEVISASIIIGVIMAPSVALLRKTLESSRRVEQASAMATLGVGKLEEQLGVAANGFQDGIVTGDFAAEGYPALHFAAVRTQAPAAGGIPGLLMAVVVEVWNDLDDDNRPDAEEPSYRFAGKVTRP